MKFKQSDSKKVATFEQYVFLNLKGYIFVKKVAELEEGGMDKLFKLLFQDLNILRDVYSGSIRGKELTKLNSYYKGLTEDFKDVNDLRNWDFIKLGFKALKVALFSERNCYKTLPEVDKDISGVAILLLNSSQNFVIEEDFIKFLEMVIYKYSKPKNMVDS